MFCHFAHSSFLVSSLCRTGIRFALWRREDKKASESRPYLSVPEIRFVCGVSVLKCALQTDDFLSFSLRVPCFQCNIARLYSRESVMKHARLCASLCASSTIFSAVSDDIMRGRHASLLTRSCCRDDQFSHSFFSARLNPLAFLCPRLFQSDGSSKRALHSAFHAAIKTGKLELTKYLYYKDKSLLDVVSEEVRRGNKGPYSCELRLRAAAIALRLCVDLAIGQFICVFSFAAFQIWTLLSCCFQSKSVKAASDSGFDFYVCCFMRAFEPRYRFACAVFFGLRCRCIAPYFREIWTL